MPLRRRVSCIKEVEELTTHDKIMEGGVLAVVSECLRDVGGCL